MNAIWRKRQKHGKQHCGRVPPQTRMGHGPLLLLARTGYTNFCTALIQTPSASSRNSWMSWPAETDSQEAT